MERLQLKRLEDEAKAKQVAVAHDKFITGKNIEERMREEKLRIENEEKDRALRRKEENKESTEHDHEIKAIREHYLGGGEKKRKSTKPSEKFSKIFQFEWEDTDDTARHDLNPLYNKRVKINALFGRGYIAGVDQKEQRKDSSFLCSLSEKRIMEAHRLEDSLRPLTEEEKQERARARDRLTEELRVQQLRQISSDLGDKNKLGLHWSEKPLEAMTERDWRIFREDFDIRIQGGRATLPLRFWKEANLPVDVMRAIESVGYEKPSPIQRQAIPIGLARRDIIGIAETGSGKTAAFVIPLLSYMLQLPKFMIDRCEFEGPLAIIMARSASNWQSLQTFALRPWWAASP